MLGAMQVRAGAQRLLIQPPRLVKLLGRGGSGGGGGVEGVEGMDGVEGRAKCNTYLLCFAAPMQVLRQSGEGLNEGILIV